MILVEDIDGHSIANFYVTISSIMNNAKKSNAHYRHLTERKYVVHLQGFNRGSSESVKVSEQCMCSFERFLSVETRPRRGNTYSKHKC